MLPAAYHDTAVAVFMLIGLHLIYNMCLSIKANAACLTLCWGSWVAQWKRAWVNNTTAIHGWELKKANWSGAFLPITTTLSIYGCLWAHAYRTGWIALSTKCVTVLLMLHEQQFEKMQSAANRCLGLPGSCHVIEESCLVGRISHD